MEEFNYQHGGNIFSHARKFNISVSEIIDSSASLIPFKTPSHLVNTLISEIKDGIYRYYPEINLKQLKEVISKFHDIPSENILPGNGASELITWVGLEASSKGKNCLPSPCFIDYERSLKAWEAEYTYSDLPLNNFKNTSHKFPINPKCDVLWITNPHNPTGQLWNRFSLEKIVNRYKLVICDESFLSITPKGEKESLIPLIKSFDNLIVIRSLTKLFSIPGIRLGYLLGPAKTLQKLNQKRDPWPLNSFAIRAGITLLNHKDEYQKWIKKIHKWILKEKSWIYPELKKINNLRVYDSSTNFFLIESDFALNHNINYLARKGIIIRECASFRTLNEKWARISLQTHIKNKKIVKEIQSSFLK